MADRVLLEDGTGIALLENGDGVLLEQSAGGAVNSPLKIGRLVSVRGPVAHRLRTGRITATAGGDVVTVVVKGAETYTDIGKWSRSSPYTAGWIRT